MNTTKSIPIEPENIYLEDIRGEKAMAWVEAHNKESLFKLESDLRYEGVGGAFKRGHFSRSVGLMGATYERAIWSKLFCKIKFQRAACRSLSEPTKGCISAAASRA